MGTILNPNPFATLTFTYGKPEHQTTAALLHFQVENDGYAGYSIGFKECLINPAFMHSLVNDDVGNGALRHDYLQNIFHRPGSSFGGRRAFIDTPFEGKLRDDFIQQLELNIINRAAEIVLERYDGEIRAKIEIFGTAPFEKSYSFTMKHTLIAA
jgi:hypothetical protein